MKAYSTREVAELLGPPDGARSLADALRRRDAAARQRRPRELHVSGSRAATHGQRAHRREGAGAAHHESAPGAREPAPDRSAALGRARADRRRPRDRPRQREQLGARVEANGPRLLHSRARPEGGAARARVRAARAARRVDGRRLVRRSARERGDRRDGRGRERVPQHDRRRSRARGRAHQLGPAAARRQGARRSGAALSARARARAESPDGAVQFGRSARGPRRDSGCDRASTSKPCGSIRASPTCTSTSRGSISRPAISRPRYATSRASAR